MSRMTTLARCFKMLARNSSNDRTARTDRNELSSEAARDCAISGLLWRRTTLDFIFPSESSPSAVLQAASASKSENGAHVNLRRRLRQPFYLRPGAFSARDSNGSAWSLPFCFSRISTLPSAASNSLRQEAESCMPSSNKVKDFSSGTSPFSNS